MSFNTNNTLGFYNTRDKTLPTVPSPMAYYIFSFFTIKKVKKRQKRQNTTVQNRTKEHSFIL
jgi:hypothetical protein